MSPILEQALTKKDGSGAYSGVWKIRLSGIRVGRMFVGDRAAMQENKLELNKCIAK